MAFQGQAGEMFIGTSWGTASTVKDLLARNPSIQADTRRVPESREEAETTIRAAIAKSGGCGLWVVEAGSDRVAVHPFGACGAPVPVASPTAGPAPAPAPVPAAPPPPPIASVSVPPPPLGALRGGADERWALLVEMTAPDPAAAVLQSALIGFGAGHFYCNNENAGYAHLGVQLGGTALTVAGAFLAASESGGTVGPVVQNVGLLGVLTSRLVEVVTVPYAARRERRRLAEQGG